MHAQKQRAIEKVLSGHFNRILLETGTQKAIENRLSQLNNIWFQLTIPSIDILESVCRPIKIKMGNVYESIAEIIARDNFDMVERNKNIEGKLTDETIIEIDSIINEYITQEKLPHYEQDKKRIIAAQKKGQPSESKRESIDLYLTRGKKEICVELKSGGKFDTTVAPAQKRRLLQKFAILNSEHAECKMGLTYNAFGEEAEFRWAQMTTLFELNKELLVGKTLWNFIGQSDKTYDELKKIFSKVGPPMECGAIDVINKILQASPNNKNKVRLTYKKYRGIFEP